MPAKEERYNGIPIRPVINLKKDFPLQEAEVQPDSLLKIEHSLTNVLNGNLQLVVECHLIE